MKKLIPILLIFLFACHKENKPVSFETMATLFANDELPADIEAAPGARGGIKGKPKPPQDTTTPPPVIKDTVGLAVVIVDFDGHYNTYYRFTQGYREGILEVTTEEQRKTIVDSIAFDWQNKWGDIIFTTDETVYKNAPTQKRMRILFTTDYEWYPNAVGGVAVNSSFEVKDAVCFVFVGQYRIVPWVTKFLWEAGSHELGHTLGLHHIAQWENGILTANYCNLQDVYPDHAHLMGIPYYNITDAAPGRMANGVVDDPNIKVPKMLD